MCVYDRVCMKWEWVWICLWCVYACQMSCMDYVGACVTLTLTLPGPRLRHFPFPLLLQVLAHERKQKRFALRKHIGVLLGFCFIKIVRLLYIHFVVLVCTHSFCCKSVMAGYPYTFIAWLASYNATWVSYRTSPHRPAAAAGATWVHTWVGNRWVAEWVDG